MRLLFEVLRLALQTVMANKVRSFLTVLGVIIGTGTIIGVGSILVGLGGSIENQIRSMGTSTVIVSRIAIGPGVNGRSPEERQRKNLTYQDALDIAERCPSVERVSPYLLPPGAFGGGGGGIGRAIYKGNDFFGANVFGTVENYSNT